MQTETTIPNHGVHSKIKIYIYPMMLFFFIAPFEDLLTGQFGTVAKNVALIVVAFSLYYYKGNIRFKLKNGNVLLLYLMGLSLVSCLWALDLRTAVLRDVAYITLPGFYLFVSSLDYSEKEIDLIETSAIFGGFFAVLYMFLTGLLALNGEMRLELSANNDPNNLAALLFFPLILAFKRFATQRTASRFFYLFVTLLLAYSVLCTGSRGALFALFCFAFFYFLFSNAYKKMSVVLGMLVLLIILWRFVIPLLPEYLQWRLFNTESYIGSESGNASRSSIWRTTIKNVIPQHLILGVGSGCSPIALNPFFGMDKGVHNTFLNMICEYGVWGIWAFLLFLWKKINEQIRSHNSIYASLLIGICVIAFFLDSFAKKFLWNVLIFLSISENQR